MHYQAYESAGLEPKDVDAYWLGTMGSGISGLTCQNAQDSVQAGDPGREHVRDRSGSLRRVHAVARRVSVAMAIGVESSRFGLLAS
jgi:hypothetical protein